MVPYVPWFLRLRLADQHLPYNSVSWAKKRSFVGTNFEQGCPSMFNCNFRV